MLDPLGIKSNENCFKSRSNTLWKNNASLRKLQNVINYFVKISRTFYIFLNLIPTLLFSKQNYVDS